MTFTNAPIGNSFNHELSPTGTFFNRKRLCEMRSNSLKRWRTKTRFLLKETATQRWLADHDLISDCTIALTDNPSKAIHFVTMEAAVNSARQVLHIYPDLCVDTMQFPFER
ncbi:MAG: hypothetical protein ACO28M_09175 [Vulcanococcus sp.]